MTSGHKSQLMKPKTRIVLNLNVNSFGDEIQKLFHVLNSHLFENFHIIFTRKHYKLENVSCKERNKNFVIKQFSRTEKSSFPDTIKVGVVAVSVPEFDQNDYLQIRSSRIRYRKLKGHGIRK